jgi:hypothetical protein
MVLLKGYTRAVFGRAAGLGGLLEGVSQADQDRLGPGPPKKEMPTGSPRTSRPVR